MSDIDEYLNQQKRILEELSNIDNKFGATKKEYVIRLKEVTRPLLESGYYENKTIYDLSSIIQEMLDNNNIEYSKGHFYDLFDDDEKRPWGESSLREQKISSLPIEKRTGIKDIDKLKQVERSGYLLPENYEYGKYLKLIQDFDKERLKQTLSIKNKLANSLAYVAEFEKIYENGDIINEIKNTSGNRKKELEERYNCYLKSQDTIQSIEKGLSNNMEKIKEELAEARLVSKQLDERNKITFVEKWNCIICNKLDQTKSYVAKLLGIDKKHISNSILPEKHPSPPATLKDPTNKHHNYISWFKAIQVETPNGEKFTFDAKNYFDEQIERGKLNIPFKPLILRNCEA